jgi:hypothetical protein
MRILGRLAVAAAGAGLLLAPLFGAAPASASTQATARLTGGTTTVTTAPGIAVTLIKNGIIPLRAAPGTERLTAAQGSPAARFAFPVTGGAVDLSPLGGTIGHRGGIVFASVKTGTAATSVRY